MRTVPAVMPTAASSADAHAVVRCVDWKHNERFNSTQAVGQQENPAFVAQPACRGKPALHVKCQHSAEPSHLLFRQAMIGMGSETRIMNFGDFRVTLQKTCHGHGALTLAPDPKFEGFQSTNQEIRRIRIHGSAETNH